MKSLGGAAVAAALVLISVTAPAFAEGDGTDERFRPRALESAYRVTWLGFPVYRGRLDAEIGRKRYRIRYEAEAQGVVRLVARSRITGEAEGRVTPEGLQPERFVLRESWRGKLRTIVVRYNGEREPTVTIEPEESPGKRKPVPEELRRGTIDPATALLAAATMPMAETPHEHRLALFEGRRRADVEIEQTGKQSRFHSSYVPDLPDRSTKARLTLHRIAGFTRGHMREHPELEPAEMWVVRMEKAGVWLPVRFRVSTKWGPVKARLVHFREKPVSGE